MQDMVVDDLVATHRVDGKTEILIQGTNGEDHDHHMIGGAGSDPCQMAIVDRPKPIQHVGTLVHQQDELWVFSCEV